MEKGRVSMNDKMSGKQKEQKKAALGGPQKGQSMYVTRKESESDSGDDEIVRRILAKQKAEDGHGTFSSGSDVDEEEILRNLVGEDVKLEQKKDENEEIAMILDGVINEELENKETLQLTPLQKIDRYISVSRLETSCKLILNLTDSAAYNRLEVNRMSYTLYKEIGEKLMSFDKGRPTCLTSYGNVLAVGNSYGIVKLLDFQGSFDKNITVKELLGKKVTAVDINKGGTHLVAGYENGSILLWDLSRSTSVKLTTNVHSSCVLSVRFLKGPKLAIISSEAGGDINITEFPKAIFGLSTNITLLTKKKAALGLCPLFPLPAIHGKVIDEGSFIAIADIEEVFVAVTEPSIRVIWSYKFRGMKRALPYIDWGRGALPGNELNVGLVLAIALDKVVQLVEISDILTQDSYRFSGHYECGEEIVSLFWLTEGVLAILTSMREIKILYTGLFTPGKYHEKPADGYQKHPAEIEYGHQIGEDVLSSEVRIGRSSSGEGPEHNLRTSFHQTVVTKDRRIICLSKSCMRIGRLSSWGEYLNELAASSQWTHALRFCLKLYSGEIKGYADMVGSKEEMEANLQAYMKDFVLRYLDNIIQKEKDITTSAPNSIEFCVAIGAIYYLCKEIAHFFQKINKEDFFIQSLESFILGGKLIEHPVPDIVFKMIIDYYSKKGQTDMIEKLLLKLNLKEQDLTYLGNFCVKHKLFFALVYIKTFAQKAGDIVAPLSVLAEEMEGREEMATVRLEWLLEYVVNQDFLASRNYIGYLLLWYINLCLKRQKFPPNARGTSTLTEKTYCKVLFKILAMLVEKKKDYSLLEKLLRVDFAIVFSTFTFLLENYSIRDILLNPSKKVLLRKVRAVTYMEIIQALDAAVVSIEGYHAEGLLKHAYCKFVARVAAIPGISITNAMCLNIAIQLSGYNQDVGGAIMDRREYEQLILAMLRSCPTLNPTQIGDLISKYSSRAFPEVLIYLRELKGDYVRCLDTFLSIRDPQVVLKVFEWLREVPQRIEETSEGYKDLKDAILDKLEALLALDMGKTIGIVDLWFQNEQDIVVIGKLAKQPKLQLGYLTSFLKDKAGYILQLQKDEGISGSLSEDSKRYAKLLELHIELLCDIEPRNVVPALKQKYYPTESCLKLCKRKKHKPAIAYLFKKVGDYLESLSTYLEVLSEIGREFSGTLSDLQAATQEFESICGLTIKVCRKNAIVVGSDVQSLWFMLLDHLYELMMDAYGGMKLDFSENQEKFVVLLNSQITKLLSEMMSFVEFPTILSRVTDKYGELEIEGFKKMFTDMLFSYFYQEKILETASKILGNSIVSQFKVLSKSRSKGFPISQSVCGKCDRPILTNSDAQVVTYACGHIYHAACTRPIGTCYYCTYREVRSFSLDQVMKKEEKKEESRKVEDSDEEEGEKEEEKKQVVPAKGRKEDYLRRLRVFEKLRVKSFAMVAQETEAIAEALHQQTA